MDTVYYIVTTKYILQFYGHWGHCQIILQLLTKLCIASYASGDLVETCSSPLDSTYSAKVTQKSKSHHEIPYQLTVLLCCL